MAKSSQAIDLKTELKRLRLSKNASVKRDPASYVKKTFEVDQVILDRFLSAIEQRGYRIKDCITEAIILWLMNNE